MSKSNFKQAIADYVNLSRQIAELENKKALLASQLQKDMGQTEELRVDGYIVRYKTVESSRFDSKSFRENHEALYQAFCKPSIARRFTIS